MREILFRGKCIDNGEWVYGYLFITRKGKHNIKWYDEHYGSSKTSEVVPETVGQYTGRWDTDLVKIFEGDLCRDKDGRLGEIAWGSSSRGAGWSFVTVYLDATFEQMKSGLTVVGNKFDSPELVREMWFG